MAEPVSESEVDELIDGIRKFVDSVVVALEKKHAQVLDNPRLAYDERGVHSAEVRKLKAEVRRCSAEAGYYQMFAPRAVGGGGFGAYTLYRVWEGLHHRYGPGRILPIAAVAHWAYGPGPLCSHLTEVSSTAMLAPFIHGEITACFGMSEPDAGSDAWAMRTKALRSGNEWVITGTKQWITNSPMADYIFVFAVTDEELRRERKSGISSFLVPMKSPGLK